MEIWETMKRKVETRRKNRDLKINKEAYERLEEFCKAAEDCGGNWFDIMIADNDDIILDISTILNIRPFDMSMITILKNTKELSLRVEQAYPGEEMAPDSIVRYVFKHRLFE